jgi:hypothetical protein
MCVTVNQGRGLLRALSCPVSLHPPFSSLPLPLSCCTRWVVRVLILRVHLHSWPPASGSSEMSVARNKTNPCSDRRPSFPFPSFPLALLLRTDEPSSSGWTGTNASSSFHSTTPRFAFPSLSSDLPFALLGCRHLTPTFRPPSLALSRRSGPCTKKPKLLFGRQRRSTSPTICTIGRTSSQPMRFVLDLPFLLFGEEGST